MYVGLTQVSKIENVRGLIRGMSEKSQVPRWLVLRMKGTATLSPNGGYSWKEYKNSAIFACI